LDSRPYFDLSLATDGNLVRFDRTLLELAQLIESGFHGRMLGASVAQDLQTNYKYLIGVRGIGDTIGAKLVRYLLREIRVGHVPAGAGEP